MVIAIFCLDPWLLLRIIFEYVHVDRFLAMRSLSMVDWESTLCPECYMEDIPVIFRGIVYCSCALCIESGYIEEYVCMILTNI